MDYGRPNISTTVPPVLSHSWSTDSLRVLAFRLLNPPAEDKNGWRLLSKLRHPTFRVVEASTFQLVDLIVSAMVSSDLNSAWINSRPPVLFQHDLVAWFAEEQHQPILRALMTTRTAYLQAFTTRWMDFAFGLSPWRALPSNYLRAFSGVKLLGTSPNLNIDEGPLLLRALERFVHHGWVELYGPVLHIRPDLDLSGPFLSALESGQLESVNFFLKNGVEISRVDRLMGQGLCCSSVLGHALQLWASNQHIPTQRDKVVRLLLDDSGVNADLWQPCWEIFTAVDMCSMIASETPSAGHFTTRLFQLGAKHSSITHITEAARSVNPTAHLEQLLKTGTVSPLDLEVALAGALRLNCYKLAKVLLRYGTHPDSPNIDRKRLRQSHNELCSLRLSYIVYIFARLISHTIGNTRHQEMVALLIEQGAAIDGHYGILEYPDIFSAAVKQSIQRRMLNDNTADVHWGKALDLAVLWNDPAFFDAVMERAPDKPARKNTSLLKALGMYETETVKSFWERGARLPLVGDRWDISAYWAYPESDRLRNSIVPTLRFLLDQGASPNCFCSLFHYWRNSHSLLELTRVLLQSGADPNHSYRGFSGRTWTPVSGAIEIARFDVLDILLGAGAKLQDRNILHDALLENDPTGRDSQQQLIAKVLELCHSQGVDVSEVASRALAGAASDGYVNIATDLLKAGVDVNGGVACRDSACIYCQTPLERAVRNGHIEMARLLVNAGAEGFTLAEGSSSAGASSLPDLGGMATLEQMTVALSELTNVGRLSPVTTPGRTGQMSRRFRKAIILARKWGVEWGGNNLAVQMLEEYQAVDLPMCDEEAALYAQSCPIKEKMDEEAGSDGEGSTDGSSLSSSDDEDMPW